MSGDGSLRYWSHETRHSSSHHHNDDGICDNESLEVSAGDGRREHRYLDTSHYSYRKIGVYNSNDDERDGSRYQEARHYCYCNLVVYIFFVDGRVGTRSQETSHSSSLNCVARVDIDGRGVYRSHTRNSSSHNPGGPDLGLAIQSASTMTSGCSRFVPIPGGGGGVGRGEIMGVWQMGVGNAWRVVPVQDGKSKVATDR